MSGAPAMSCPACGSSALRLHLPGTGARLDQDTLGAGRTMAGHVDILRCEACGHGFPREQPTSEFLAALYRDLQEEPYQAEEQAREQTARRRLRTLHRYVRGGHLLDVGCATGGFLQLALRAGWSVSGVDPSVEMCRAARARLGPDATVLNETVQSGALPTDAFHAVTLWDVLEHVGSPTEVLRRAATLLRAGGFLLVNVPRVDSAVARLLGRRWPLLLPEHLHYFSLHSLRLCGERAGLRWIGSRTLPSSFSVNFILHRLAQHDIPGARPAQTAALRSGLGRRTVAVRTGDVLGVWRRDG